MYIYFYIDFSINVLEEWGLICFRSSAVVKIYKLDQVCNLDDDVIMNCIIIVLYCIYFFSKDIVLSCFFTMISF